MEPKSNKPTLKDVAKLAGVSVATASRAMQNHPRQSPDTCLRVQQAARELGYVTHPLVSALMTEIRKGKPSSFNNTVALVHCYHIDFVPPPSLHDLRAGAIEAASHLGYKIEEFFLYEKGMTPQRLVDILYNRGIHGAIFEQVIGKGPEEVRLDMDLSKFASIAVEFSLTEPNLNRVDVDQYNGLRLAFNKVVERGYERIGLVTHSMEEHLCQQKRLAAMLLMQNENPTLKPVPPLVTPYKKEHLLRNLDQWIQEHEVDVILSPRRVLPQELEEIGYRVPKDISFAHLMLNEKNAEGYSGVLPNWSMVGGIAVQQVIDHLNRNQFGVPEKPIITYAPGEWVDGYTLPKRKKRIPQTAKASLAALD